jgi:hypothetical protein
MKRPVVVFFFMALAGRLSAQLILPEDSLSSHTIELSEVVVTARPPVIDSRGLGNMRINMRQLKFSPLFFGEKDIIKTLQFLPGVSAGMEGSSQLNIRGGTNDQTLYLMDDVPVYNQNHTFGFFSIFNSDALQSADLYKGGIPAMYGDRLSGVASIALKDGNFKRYNHSFSLGLLTASLASEGPILKEKLSYMVTARKSFLDLIYNGIMSIASEGDGGVAMIAFHDINGKIDWKINHRNKLICQIYSGYDDLYGMNKETDSYKNEKTMDKFGFGWKTFMSSLRIVSEIKPNLSFSGNLYYTRLNNFNYVINQWKSKGEGNRRMENNISSLLEETGFRSSATQKVNDANRLFYGLETTRQIFTPNHKYKKVDNHKTEYGKNQLKLYTASAYVYDEYRLRDWLFSVGVRASVYNNAERTRFVFDPRLKVNKYLGEKNKVMLAYDRMHQPIQSINEMNYSVQTDFWIPFRENRLPASHQFSIGWKNYTSRMFGFSIEAYHKKLDNLILIKDFDNYLDFHSDYETGSGRLMGIELLLEYTQNRFNSWFSYTLSKSERRFDGKTYPFKYDSPHDVSAYAGYTVRKNEKTINTLSFNMQYKTGYPYYVPEVKYPSMGLPTSDGGYEGLNDISHVDYIPQYPNVRLKNYFRLDLTFTMEQRLKHGSRTWQFSLLNTTAQKNPYAVYKKDGKYKSFVLIPFLPSLSFVRSF